MPYGNVPWVLPPVAFLGSATFTDTSSDTKPLFETMVAIPGEKLPIEFNIPAHPSSWKCKMCKAGKKYQDAVDKGSGQGKNLLYGAACTACGVKSKMEEGVGSSVGGVLKSEFDMSWGKWYKPACDRHRGLGLKAKYQVYRVDDDDEGEEDEE
ncbi:hypothetical protein FB45DRAFT_882732 [Roridomyces roridus]|uniref:Uncharacterized protein n=1 Tax=Roridomyces roridus TaxID=1738132 RepID=A0AAD7F7L5_9AGAR|nr:hypothetical protein FB45DRAFT_882732 [Roridomyces roridus]